MEEDFYSVHMESLTWSVNLAPNLSFPTSVCLSFYLFPCILASHCHKQPHLFPWQQQAGRLYAVHCLWWVRRTGRERCKGKGRERGRIICASISRIAAEGVRRRERCRLLRQRGEEGGEAESSLDPRPQMSHDREEPALSRLRGAVSAQRWCHDLFWGSDVRPLQWGWPCSTVALLSLTVTADVKWHWLKRRT